MTHPDSPNGKWARLGCSIEREPIPGQPAYKSRRTIRAADGTVIPIEIRPGEDRHAAEDRTATALLEAKP